MLLFLLLVIFLLSFLNFYFFILIKCFFYIDLFFRLIEAWLSHQFKSFFQSTSKSTITTDVLADTEHIPLLFITTASQMRKNKSSAFSLHNISCLSKIATLAIEESKQFAVIFVSSNIHDGEIHESRQIAKALGLLIQTDIDLATRRFFFIYF
jgi:hypothetical protein